MNTRRLVAWSLLLGTLCVGNPGAWASHSLAPVAPVASAQPLRLAVLGDSDSQSYQVRLRPTSQPTGGRHAKFTLQWTELLEQLAYPALDLGSWNLYGTDNTQARLRRKLGLSARTPQKEDFAYNFAFGGATCDDLSYGLQAQLPHLLALMNKDAQSWKRSVVVIRAGIVDFGYKDSLDLLAQDPQAPVVKAKMDHCVQHMQDVVRQVHARHSAVRFVIVGIFDNRHWPPYLPHWQSAQEGNNIAAGMDYFDNTLRAWAHSDARLAFYDERQLFAQHFGGRDAQGKPAYRSWSPTPDIHVRVSQGDSPDNLTLDNAHNGLAYNMLWAQGLLAVINERFAAGLPPIAAAAVGKLLAKAMAAPDAKY